MLNVDMLICLKTTSLTLSYQHNHIKAEHINIKHINIKQC